MDIMRHTICYNRDGHKTTAQKWPLDLQAAASSVLLAATIPGDDCPYCFVLLSLFDVAR